ncbi:protein abrupt isoform X1 [Copidosoma floridanum]|uniref:protein abrupt isoform X1 n=1 Tax=Copidosoma floridanum TaxID=29053 RepID=UPI0006C98F97|nr:protein abrupt isoform X1 [Copidosoma floridanum]XP_014203276.1 protein abrupt isoform X1 [Copidosoma floridanum]
MAASSSSSSGEQQYSLRWNDYHSSIVNSFRHLRDEEDFVDVTLACDNSSFTAHKVVLSACSPYFRKLLKANPCQHPIVILRDVSSSDMESLLRFMYHGEVHVGQEQLTAFIKTAQMLQVRGLADVPAITSKVQTATSSTPHNASAPTTPRNLWQDSMRSDLNDSGLSPPPEKRPRSYSPSLVNHIEAKSDIHESLLSQALEGGPTIHTTASANNNQAQSVGEDSNSISDNEEETLNNDSMLNSVKTEPSELLNDSLEHHRNSFPAALLSLQGLMPGPSGIHAAANADPNYGRRNNLDIMRVRATDPRPCPKCKKIYRSAHTLRTHLEDKHTICPGYRCVLCGTVAKSRNSLHSHMSRQHRGISTKDLPVLPMPSPFNPELASQLLAKAGVNVSPAELRARASPTGPRRGDMRLEMTRQSGGAPSEAGSSLCGGDDPEDLTLPLSLRYGSMTPNNNTVITKVMSSGGGHGQSNNNGKSATPGGPVAAKSLDSLQVAREPQTAPYHQHQQLQHQHRQQQLQLHQQQQQQQQQQQPHAFGTESAVVSAFLQLIADNSAAMSGLTPDQAAIYAAKMAQMGSVDKLGRALPDDYPIIGRDEGRNNNADHDHDGNSSAGEEDDFSENEEPEVVRAE